MEQVCPGRTVFVAVDTVLTGDTLPFGIKHIAFMLPGQCIPHTGRRRETQRDMFVTIIGVDILGGDTIIEVAQKADIYRSFRSRE